MSIPRHCGANERRRGQPAARLAVLALLACGVVCVSVVDSASADPRFGESTWVAPGAAFDSSTTTDGPRVASPDHARPWETALRAPFRIVFFPLRLVAKGLEASAGPFGRRFLEPKSTRPPKEGIRLEPSIGLDAMNGLVFSGEVNDIGVGPAITSVGFPTADARLHLTGSWSANDRRSARFSGANGDPRPVGFALRADYDYIPNRRYYGIGNSTPETDLSYFLLESINAEASLHLGTSPLRQVRIVGGYSSMSPDRGYNGQPLLEYVFASTSVPFQHQNTQELLYGVTADLAVLDDERDPSRGLHGRFDVRHASGLRSSDPDYYQWRVEGRAYVPVFAKRRVIAVRGVYAGVDPSGDTTTALPFYRLAQSEGDSRFAGYPSGRFRDQQLALTRIEYRWTILHGLSALGLYELSAVAPRWESFTLSDAHESYGGGLRIAMSDEATLRLEVAKTVEGVQAVLAVGGDL